MEGGETAEDGEGHTGKCEGFKEGGDLCGGVAEVEPKEEEEEVMKKILLLRGTTGASGDVMPSSDLKSEKRLEIL